VEQRTDQGPCKCDTFQCVSVQTVVKCRLRATY
jgi:hypothetical protein